MTWQAALAIYILFWVMTAFVILPFEAKTHDEAGIPKIPGQAESAPANFSPLRVVIRTTILATLLFGLYYANYVEGWVTAETLTGVRT
jgi:predicted secreted protein